MALLAQQAAIVTGAGQGIGRAIALRLASEGADIGIIDISREPAEATAAEIHRTGTRAVVQAVDVGDCDAVQAAVRTIAREFGRLDILVNNAGIAKLEPFLSTSRTNWERQIATHLSGTFYCSQAAAQIMVEREYGRIICLSSVAGLMGPPDNVPYAAAKTGIIGLTRAMALDLAERGVTVNAIAPAPIETEILAIWSEEARQELRWRQAIPRLGRPEEIAHAALFLASPESAFISGIVLPVDGGSHAAGSYLVEIARRRRAATAGEG